MRHQITLAVGHDDRSAPTLCRCEFVPELAALHRVAVAGALDRIARDIRPDVIHIHNALGPAALEWAAQHDAIMTVQDHRCFCPGQGKLTAAGEVCDQPLEPERCGRCSSNRHYGESIFRRTTARLSALKSMRSLTVLSNYMKGQLVGVGVRPATVTVIRPLLSDLDSAAPAAGPECVLFAGRLVKAKGVWDAVAAWQQSAVALPLVFAGTGPERAKLEATGAEVLGWVAHERMSAVYRRARALLLPSRWQEPCGIVGPEALSLGVPVVAWRSGGVAEWHPGDGLVDWGDVPALAEALRQAITRRAEAPTGFAAADLMDRLERVYLAG